MGRSTLCSSLFLRYLFAQYAYAITVYCHGGSKRTRSRCSPSLLVASSPSPCLSRLHPGFHHPVAAPETSRSHRGRRGPARSPTGRWQRAAAPRLLARPAGRLVLQRRQHLPDAAFWTPAEAVDCCVRGGSPPSRTGGWRRGARRAAAFRTSAVRGFLSGRCGAAVFAPPAAASRTGGRADV